ncbi:MAG: hypothetical protein ACRDQZ_17970, partial [Mycobacteriales bacterium]
DTLSKQKIADRDVMVLGSDKAKLPDEAKGKVPTNDGGWGLKVRPKPGDTGDDQDFDPAGTDNYSRVIATKQSQAVWEMWSGGKGGERFAIAVMAVIAAMTFGVMLITIAVSYLVMQIATVLFALAAPLVFLIGLVPVYGMRVLLRWGELFLGTFIKRVAMVIFVAVLLTLYQLILDTEGVPWWLQMTLILAIAVGGASYRKKLTSLSTLGFGGGGGGGGGLGMSSAKVSAMQNTWQDTRGMPITSRVASTGRAGAQAGTGTSGVRSSSLGGQGQQAYAMRAQQAAASRAGRGGAYRGYSPAAAGPAQRSYGTAPVQAMQAPGGAGRGPGNTRPGGPVARGTASTAASSRGTYMPYDARSRPRSTPQQPAAAPAPEAA